MAEPKEPREPRIPKESPPFDADNKWTRTWIMYFESLFRLSVKEAVRQTLEVAVTHSGELTKDLPVFGADAAVIKVGTKSGNTNKVVTNTGTNVTGNTVKWDASGNLIDAGSAPGGGSGTVTHTGGALTADQPVFGAGSADIKVGTKTGNTNKLVSNTGTNVTGNTVKWDANGNLIDAGSAPGSGMAIGGPVTSGTDGSILFVASGNLAQDNADLFWDNTNKRVGIGTNTPGHPLHVYATDPAVGGVPIEQVMVENPATSGTNIQANIAFKVYDGSAHTTIGWVGATCGSFTFGPYANATYLENFSTGGLVLLSDDPTYGHIKMYSGGYTSDDYKRVHIDAAGQVVIREWDGSTQGLQVQLVAQNSNAAKSYANINFYDVNTLVGQFLATASNYVNSGVNVGASGVALLSEISTGHLLLGAAGSSGTVRINAGGYDSTFTTVEFPAAGGMQVKRGGISFSGASSSDFIKADGSGYGIPGGSGTVYYQTVQANGTPVTQRAKLNVAAGTNVTVTASDNGTDTTTLTIASTGGGSGGVTSQNVVTGSRAIGTVYHNTGSGAIHVSVTAHSNSAAHASMLAQTDSSNPPTTYVAYQCLPSTPDAQSIFFIVLPGNYYKVTINVGTPTLDVWTEWS